jgi:hypothetical protein
MLVARLRTLGALFCNMNMHSGSIYITISSGQLSVVNVHEHSVS